MLSNRTLADTAIWLAVIGLTLGCALVVIELAFQSSALALSAGPAHIYADYSADPRAARMLKIAPINSAVITDTLNDIAAEQSHTTQNADQLAPSATQLAPSPTSTPTIHAADTQEPADA